MDSRLFIVAVIALLPGPIVVACLAWRRCITNNHANLDYQDHQNRINEWRQWIKACIVVGACYSSVCYAAWQITGNELWKNWGRLGLGVNIVILLLVFFPFQLHVRHQKGKQLAR